MSAADKRVELLQRRITGCTNCGLHLYCRLPVPPLIPSTTITPELLLIGEAPGAQEDREGEPFVGPAGGLMFKWLKLEMGLHRKLVMIGNTVSCRPTVKDAGKMNRQPSKLETQRCRGNLARAVDYYLKVGGRWMLLAGSTALQAFIPDARIGQWAGRPFVLQHDRGLLYAMATYHPAAALRDMRHGPTIRRHLNVLGGLRRDLGAAWPERCFCGAVVARYDPMGIAWCADHLMLRRGITRVPAIPSRQEEFAM